MKIVKASWYVFPTFPETSCMTVFLVPYRVARGTEIFAIFQGDDQTKIPTYMAESGVCKRQEEVSIMKHPDFWQTFIQNNGIWTWHMFLGPTLLGLYKILISHTSVSGYGGKKLQYIYIYLFDEYRNDGISVILNCIWTSFKIRLWWWAMYYIISISVFWVMTCKNPLVDVDRWMLRHLKPSTIRLCV